MMWKHIPRDLYVKIVLKKHYGPSQKKWKMSSKTVAVVLKKKKKKWKTEKGPQKTLRSYLGLDQPGHVKKEARRT